MSDTVFAAADLGATSGRVMAGRVAPGRLAVTEAHRFHHTPVSRPGGLFWDLPALRRGVLDGLRSVARGGGAASIGIDSWAVDYGLLDARGRLLRDPYCYRDERTAGLPELLDRTVAPDELYRINGLQRLAFNTVYQLLADRREPPPGPAVRHLLLLPDLLTHDLTGSVAAEITNASTTGLLDVRDGTWATALAGRIGLDPAVLPPLRQPGDPAGTLLPHAQALTGLPAGTPVTTVASHDTASAVAAVPATGPDFAYISCGTWSLAGLELPAPVLHEASRAAGFTNERGLDGTIRYLRNIMGLWLFEECRRTWTALDGAPAGAGTLLAEAAKAPAFAALIDPDAPEFMAPGDMPARIRAFCRRTGQRPPERRGEIVRCVMESLALAHRDTLLDAARLADREITAVHLVGGGSRNTLLCRLTADATGLPLVAGPAEATALGNILVQARAFGLVGGLPAMRRLVADTQPLRRYTPRGDRTAWVAASRRRAEWRAG